MAARRKTPAPPPLAEGSVEPSPGVLAFSDEFIRSEILRRGAPALRFVESEEETSRRIRSISYRLYDAMIAWMGPGADPAFLDFYLLAEAKMPPVVQVVWCNWTYRLDRAYQVWDGITDGFRQTAMAMATSYPPFEPRVIVENKKFSSREMDLLAAQRKTLREVQKRNLSCIWQTVHENTSIPMSYSEGEPEPLSIEFMWAPAPDYRTALMGELATPWPVPKTIPTEFVKPPRVVRRVLDRRGGWDRQCGVG